MTQLRLIATDLDGTLLGAGEQVSERNRRALMAARAAGLEVLLITGRPPRWVRALARSLDLGSPVICANGASVYDYRRGRLLAHHPMPAETAVEIVGTLRRRAPGVRFAFELGLGFGHEPAYEPLRGRALPAKMQTGDALELAQQAVTKLLARHDAIDAPGLAAAMGGSLLERAEPTWSTPYLLEVGAAGVNKASALAAFCRQHGIPAESVVAFGDMPNDLSMLRWAGIGFAMGNADPAVKAGADRVAPSNAADGLAVEIEKLLGIEAAARR